MKKLLRSTLAVASLFIASGAAGVSHVWSQVVPPTKDTPARQPSPPVAYHLFFGHVVFLDEKVLELERSGKPVGALRNHYKSRLRLQDKDETALLSRAKACEKELANHDAKAAKIIEGLRRRIPKGKTPTDLPVPQEIFQLQAERDAILAKHLTGLKSDLTAEGFGLRARGVLTPLVGSSCDRGSTAAV